MEELCKHDKITEGKCTTCACGVVQTEYGLTYRIIEAERIDGELRISNVDPIGLSTFVLPEIGEGRIASKGYRITDWTLSAEGKLHILNIEPSEEDVAGVLKRRTTEKSDETA